MRNKIILTISFIICFNLKLLAHGQEVLAYGVPIIIYTLIIPIYLSIWDYKQIVKNVSKGEFGKRWFWLQNYFIIFITYCLFYLFCLIIGNDKLVTISDTLIIFVLVGFFLIIQTFGKSLLYYALNGSKNVKILTILKSIYKVNILTILACLGLGFILGWFVPFILEAIIEFLIY